MDAAVTSTKIRHDTACVPRHERFDYWRDVVCDTFVPLGCDSDRHRDFKGEIDTIQHSALTISTVRGKSQRVRRRRCDIGRANEAYFLLSLQTVRHSRVSQFGQTALLDVGDMALYSTVEPYQLDLPDDFAEIVVQIPRERLLSRLPDADAMTARRIDGGSAMSRLVRHAILGLSEQAESAEPMVQSLIQETLVDLIATGLAAQCGSTAELSSPERHVLLRVKQFVREHLADPDLNRQRIAVEIGLSVRRLNAVLAKEGSSLSELVRHARLDRIAEALTDPRCRRLTIGEIAFRHGFQNLQHFSKAFRAHHGMAPRDYRACRAEPCRTKGPDTGSS